MKVSGYKIIANMIKDQNIKWTSDLTYSPLPNYQFCPLSDI